jgi:hypothetical protein
MELKEYLQHARLQLDYNALAKTVTHFTHKLRAAAVKDSPAGDDETLYSYQVPDLGADGSCSIADTSDPQYYDLTEILGGRSQRSTQIFQRDPGTFAGIMPNGAGVSDLALISGGVSHF